MKKIIVSPDGTGDFSTIQEALGCPEEELFIVLRPGIYYGQIFSNKKSIYIKGEDSENTIITGKIGAKDPFRDGKLTGTFRSYTAYFSGTNVILENLTIENTAGQGTVAGQAIALYASASYVFCKNVKLLGFQDTLFTGPLPEKERIPGGFCGPEQNLPRKKSTQIYENCYICGTVDFIFGSADALFKNCVIGVHKTTTECYIAAPSTPKDGIGYIFDSCKIIKCEDFDSGPQHVYLARPWRNFAKCTWLNCNFSDVICKKIWDYWGDEENKKTVEFNVFTTNSDAKTPGYENAGNSVCLIQNRVLNALSAMNTIRVPESQK